jgi:hypothetical protein
VKQAARRGTESRKINTFFLGKFEIMAYVAYEIKRSKETRRGMIYLVKCNRLGKYAITTWVGSTGSAMGSVECQGKYDYVLKEWQKNFGKERYYPLIGSTE